MELLTFLLRKKKQEEPRTADDYQRENLIDVGRQQFQKLMELGLAAPVRLA